MTKKILALLSLGSIVLVSCGGTAESDQEGKESLIDGKQAFYIETRPLSDFPREITVTKTGILEGASSIDINTQASGQVRTIYVKDGDRVVRGQALLSIEDTVSSYGLAVSSASNGVEAAELSYEQSSLSLDKGILDAQITYDKAVLDLENTRETVKEQLAQAERNLDNSTAEQNIAKAKLDLDNLEKSNQQTLDGYERTFNNELTKLQFFLLNTIDSTDQILGVGETYKYDNDAYEEFLGARNRSIKTQAIQKLQQLMASKKSFDQKDLNGTLGERIQRLEDMYDQASDLLGYMEQTLIFTIASPSFDETDIATARATIDGLQTTHQANSSSLVSFFNTSKAFLNTYESSYEASKTAYDLLVKSYETGEGNATSSLEQTKASVAQQVRAAEALVENSKNTLENAKKSKVVTLKQLENQIQSAQIGLSQASVQAGKLTLRSPIDGTVGNVLVDLGEEVSPGKPALTLSSRDTQFSIRVDQNIAQNLEPGQVVSVTYEGSSSDGIVTSVSSVADASLNYTVKIKVDTAVDFLGDFIEASIPIVSQYDVIPLENVRIISQSQGQVWVYTPDGIAQKNVVIGNIWGDVVEVISGLDLTDQIIITNMTNYNESDFSIQLKNQG